MPTLTTRSDALQWLIGGTRVESLLAIGTIPGIAIGHVAGRNGPGVGGLRSEAGGGHLVAWRAPGGAYGVPVDVSSGNPIVAEDGLDATRFVILEASPAFLEAGPRESRVFLRDRFNGFGPDDVPAAEASAGAVETFTVTMTNVSAMALKRCRVWIDAAVSGLEISTDGVSWSTPTSEAAGLDFASFTAGQSKTLHVRRTIGAAAAADPDVLNHLHGSYYGSW